MFGRARLAHIRCWQAHLALCQPSSSLFPRTRHSGPKLALTANADPVNIRS